MTKRSLPTSSAADYFGSMRKEYDSLIRRAVPRYEEMTHRLLDYLPGSPVRILELGCGTGHLSLALVRHFPDAEFTFVDASSEMVASTSSLLEARVPRTWERSTFREDRFEDLEDLGSPHLIVSCISLHHVENKKKLYRTLFEELEAGGAFCFADQFKGNSEFNHLKNWDRWLEFCRRPRHCSEEEIQSLLNHAEAHDFYTSVEDHFALLEVAGFIHLDCVWRNLIWGIITATKPSS